MTGKRIQLVDDDQTEAFADAKAAIEADVDAGDVDADRAERGRAAGEVTAGEVVRVACEAYAGTIDLADGE